MNTKNVILGMAIAAVFLIATIGSASAATKICPSCGDTIDASGAYILTCNMSCPGTHGLIIDTADVTLDGYDADNDTYHWIDGVNNDNCMVATGFPFIRCGIYTQEDDDVTIRNLEVKRFCVGILLRGHSEDCTVENCIVHSNGNPTFEPAVWLASTQGIVLHHQVNNGTITKNEIYDNIGKVGSPPCESGAAGVYLKDVCCDNSITCNNIHDNNAAGILTKATCLRDYVAYNNIYRNGEQGFEGSAGGIILRCKQSSYWLIEKNNVTDNYGPGIFIGGGWNTLRYNTVKNNHNRTTGDIPVGHGITIRRQDDWPDGGRNNTVEANAVCDNDGIDIHVFTAGYFNTGDENTCDSCNNYNDEGEPCCTNSCQAPLTFEKELVTGWNLVSLPLTPSDKTVSSVLSAIAGNYDTVVRYDVATHQFMELSSDSEMNNGVGYFIHINETGTFTWSYSGADYDSINVGLSQGLNCIGWTNTSVSLPGALNSIADNNNYVTRWNVTLQSYEVYEPNAPAPFNDFAEMERGVGYFIATKGTCTLTYP